MLIILKHSKIKFISYHIVKCLLLDSFSLHALKFKNLVVFKRSQLFSCHSRCTRLVPV